MKKMRAAVKTALVLPAFFLLTLSGSASGFQAGFQKNIAVSGITPATAVKITLKRDFKGHYFWSIEGTDLRRIILADERLRTYVSRMGKRKKTGNPGR